MTGTFMATYDGSKLIPDEPLPLEAGTRVLVTVHTAADLPQREPSQGKSFFDIARSMKIDGPSDWSSRVDHYLYGPLIDDGDEP